MSTQPRPASPADAIDHLRTIGHEFHSRGWSLGTSSNYSVVISSDPLELLVTASGKDKSALSREDFVRVDSEGRVTDGSGRRSSAETLLHCTIAELIPSVGAVLHTHSHWGTILSGAEQPARGTPSTLQIAGYEMLKGLEGIPTHDTCENVPIFANTQDMHELSSEIRQYVDGLDFDADFDAGSRPPLHGFLIARHGLYTWGRDLAEARRHIAIFEFLFECVARARTLPASTPWQQHQQ